MKPKSNKEQIKKPIQLESYREKKEYEEFEESLHFNELYDVTYALLPECYVRRLYDFLQKLAKLETMKSKGEKTSRLRKIRETISKLELIPTIQQHIWQQPTTKKEQEIEEMVEKIEEKQKLRKMGTIHKYIYQKVKKNQS